MRFATMIEYHPELDVRVAFPPLERLGGTLCEVVSRAGLRQVKVCESEKAIHVSFFLNGKSQESFPGEERVIVPSPTTGLACRDAAADERGRGGRRGHRGDAPIRRQRPGDRSTCATWT